MVFTPLVDAAAMASSPPSAGKLRLELQPAGGMVLSFSGMAGFQQENFQELQKLPREQLSKENLKLSLFR